MLLDKEGWRRVMNVQVGHGFEYLTWRCGSVVEEMSSFLFNADVETNSKYLFSLTMTCINYVLDFCLYNNA